MQLPAEVELGSRGFRGVQHREVHGLCEAVARRVDGRNRHSVARLNPGIGIGVRRICEPDAWVYVGQWVSRQVGDLREHRRADAAVDARLAEALRTDWCVRIQGLSHVPVFSVRYIEKVRVFEDEGRGRARQGAGRTPADRGASVRDTKRARKRKSHSQAHCKTKKDTVRPTTQRDTPSSGTCVTP